MLLKGKGGVNTKLSIKKIVNKDLDDKIFVFDSKIHSDVEVIDLR
jgi:hypothetical protein